MKHLLITSSLLVAMASPALANKTAVSEARINDHYKTVIEQTPYKVELCKNVQVPTKGADTLNTEGAIIGGIIGGVIGNQFGKGNGKDAMTGIGAMSGAIIGGKKEGQTTYTEQRQCELQTRYREVETRVYSHSTVTFIFEGQRYELKFSK